MVAACTLPLLLVASPPVATASLLTRIKTQRKGPTIGDAIEFHRHASVLSETHRRSADTRDRPLANAVSGMLGTSLTIADQEQQRPAQPPSELHFRPVSVTVWCVMVLAVQSFVICTALACSRNVDELAGLLQPSPTTGLLEVASRGAGVSAMVATLFVGCRMYVLATTEGLGEPPIWVKACMIIATCGLTLQIVITFLLPMVVKSEAADIASFAAIAGDNCDAHLVLERKHFKDSFMTNLLFGKQVLVMIMIYGGSFGVVFGVSMIPSQTTEVSNAVISTCIMSVMYLAVYFFISGSRMFGQSTDNDSDDNYYRELRASRAAGSLDIDSSLEKTRCKHAGVLVFAGQAMSTSVRKAPMLAAVFLAARMRALHLDPPHGLPPPIAQTSFLIVTAALFVETVAAAVASSVGRASTAYYGVYVFSEEGIAGWVRNFFCGVIYVCLVPIFNSFFHATTSESSIAPLAPTTLAVLRLAALFFFVDFAQWAVFVFEAVTKKRLSTLRDTVLAAGVGMGLTPFLAIIFIACRMRALQITQQEGSPQGWAQDLMHMSVFAIIIQVICCGLMPVFTNAATVVNADGQAEYDLRPMIGAYCVTFVKYVAFFGLHTGIIGQCVAIFAMTPETAHRGDHTSYMKSCIRLIVTSILIILISLLLSSAKIVGLAIKFGIESADEVLLGTTIEVAEAKLSIFEGYVNVNGLTVYNPPAVVGEQPWRCEHLLRFNRILVKINLWRLISSFGGTFEITAVILDGLEVHVEKPSLRGTSNIGLLLAHLMETVGPTEATPGKTEAETNAMAADSQASSPDDTSAAGSNINVDVHKVYVHDVSAWAIPPPLMGPTLAVTVAEIDFDDFSDQLKEKKGRVAANIVTIVLKTILHSIQESTMSSFANLVMPTKRCSAFCDRRKPSGLGTKSIDDESRRLGSTSESAKVG
eukprot:TRINITY_DN34807_c0_g1_i1.p1 TRINITY_DN34807_c0_g1~~TRINITY_DN34807_c0_g1_i1.p1  ORF type:complete len:981 (+),score=169.07 TRINITY_DN34807_c0_g1_i1:160-2943(+)